MEGKKSLRDTLLYKYVYVGTVHDGGKVYRKYKKTARFGNLKKGIKNILIIILSIIMLVLAIRHINTHFISPPHKKRAEVLRFFTVYARLKQGPAICLSMET